MESVIAASYMDGGFEAAKGIIDRLILCDVPTGRPHNFDYKTALQELVQRKKDQQLHYELTGESGPDHDKHFDVEVLLNGKAGRTWRRQQQKSAPSSRPRQNAAIERSFPGESGLNRPLWGLFCLYVLQVCPLPSSGGKGPLARGQSALAQ